VEEEEQAVDAHVQRAPEDDGNINPNRQYRRSGANKSRWHFLLAAPTSRAHISASISGELSTAISPSSLLPKLSSSRNTNDFGATTTTARGERGEDEERRVRIVVVLLCGASGRSC